MIKRKVKPNYCESVRSEYAWLGVWKKKNREKVKMKKINKKRQGTITWCRKQNVNKMKRKNERKKRKAMKMKEGERM